MDEKTHNPGHLVMELYSPDVVKMSVQREEAASVLRPNVYKVSDIVVVHNTERSPHTLIL